MRISKEPEIRKQEIIDTAMKVFSKKGYEATAMKDIAREMNVAAGLCYHYFENKQALYETAVRQYAKACSGPFIEIFKQIGLSLEECMEKTGVVLRNARDDGTYAYEDFFHGTGNEFFHRQLDAEMIREILPHMKTYLDALSERGEIHVSDTGAAALFILNGQIGVINNMDTSVEKGIDLLKELIGKTLQ